MDSSTIRDIMESEDAFPEEIPKRTARQGVRGFGEFKCDNCHNSWSSHRAHIVIDLQKQMVVKVWKQKCKPCEMEKEPSFTQLEFQKLVEKAIEQERKFRNKTIDDDDDDYDNGDDGGRAGPPHESSLCEKCGYGTTQCWKKRTTPSTGRRL